MALAIDSQMAAATGAFSTASGSLTFSFTNAAGTVIYVGVSWGSGAALTMSTVTYNAVGLTQEVVIGYDGATHNFAGAAIYRLLSPATGANNVVVTMSGATGGSTAILAGAITFTGHHATTPTVVGSTKTNFLESGTTSATVVSGTTTTGNIVLAQMATGTAYGSTSQTLSWSKNASGASAGGNGALTQASGTGGTITMTDTITSDFFGMVCLEVAAAAGGGGGVTFPQLERGVNRGVNRGVGTGLARSFVRRDRIFVPSYAVLGDLQAAA